MSGHSASACTEVRETNHQVAFPDYADISKTSEYENEVAEENKEVVCNGSEHVPEEEDEDEDADFNPFLQENISVEVSPSLSSEVEDLDTDVADGRGKSCTSFDGDPMEKHRDSIKDCPNSGNVSEEIVMQTAVSSKEVSATAILITQSECEKENGSNSVMNFSNTTDPNKPMVDMVAEDAICMRTRARYSLASFTLDELETFLQESDDEDDLQNVDDEDEYRKFLAAVLRGEDSENLIGNVNADDGDEENDADFELELEEALESEPEEVEERRMTRRNRCQKASLERGKKISGKSSRPLRPLLPFVFDRKHLMPNTLPSYMPRVNNGIGSGFTPHQIGQLYCLIHEHVQLLIQVFSLCVLEPAKSNISAEVKKLAVEMVQKRDQALAWRKVPYPSFCFSPPYIRPSVSDGLHKMLPPKDSNENVQRDISTKCTLWVPYVCGPVQSVTDVAPLRLVENFMDDVSSAVRAYEQYQIERGFDSGCQKEPLFPLHNFPCSAESDDQGEMENNAPDSNEKLGSSPSNQMPKKTMAATLLEKAKRNQPIALVPKEIAKLTQRFWPLFNPALYPHKPPPAALVNRVLFTDAEDELLALGLMEYNSDWKAIQQRFLPCKSRHQIFVRQKNRASSKASENPIKAVRRMKNSPLNPEEIARIESGLKWFKLDWISIWRFLVPYRDPSLLPRQWRTACGTQKSYKSDANGKARRQLYELRRKTSKRSPSTWQWSSEKEGDSTDNAVEETNRGHYPIDKEDEVYVHEAFLADWRPDDNNVSSSTLTYMPSHDGSLQPQIHSKSPAASSSQVVLRPYRFRRQNNARLVKLAPGLPPVNLPPSVRVMSQLAFESSPTVASSKISCNASKITDMSGSSVKSGPSRTNSVNIAASRCDSDLQMHPLLFQAPQDGRLPYYNCSSTSSSSSFAFFSGKQPQVSLSPFHNPLHTRDAVNFLSRSPKPPEKYTASSSGVDFHPLLQRSDDVGINSVASHPAESRKRRASLKNPSVTKSRNVNELDLDIHLSCTSKNQEAAENRDATTRGTGRLLSAPISVTVGSEYANDSGKKRDSGQDEISDELNSGEIPLVASRNKGSRRVSDTMCDVSLPGIIMEQEELSDSEEEFGENVEFECEEMADSEGDSMSDSEHVANLPNEEVRLDDMDAGVDDARMLSTQSGCKGKNTSSTSYGHLNRLGSTGKRVNVQPNVSSLNLNSHPPVSPLSNPTNTDVVGYEYGPFGTNGTFNDRNQIHASSKGSGRHTKPDPRDTLLRKPRKRVCRSNSSTSIARSGKGNSSPNVDFEYENT
ncbi:hypothetical protein OROHE_023761 [Orobanche hederae]